MMKRVSFLLAMMVAASAAASDVAVSVGAIDGTNRRFGALTPTAWRFHDERGAILGLEWFVLPNVSLDADAAELREHIRYEGERASAMRSVPASLMFQLHAPEGAAIRPYLGGGVSYLMYRDVVRSPLGVAEQPDHAAAVIGGGVDFAVAGHWSLNVDGKYGPARSTAEVITPDGAAQHIDFHQLYVSTRVRYRF